MLCFTPARDRPLTLRKERFAYSRAVVHFRKVVITQKIGSDGNQLPVIYPCGYIPAYYQTANDYGRKDNLCYW